MNESLNHEVLRLFEQLSKIPRESEKEKAVSDWIKQWSEEKGLTVSQDDIWNLIITKPGSAGYEDHPPVLLQAHIDMVCEKDNDSPHDFTKDPIQLKVDGDWLTSATGTTLGADDGIGVACAMALLADDELKHPPLEVVFTVQEETTFTGAEDVDVSTLKSKRMINLDHANERELIVGSCGGSGVDFTLRVTRDAGSGEGLDAFTLTLGGLKGGHSGEDIHRGRGNAIRLLLRLLEELSLPVISISGGTNRLAIPREASACVLSSDSAAIDAKATEFEKTLKNELGAAAEDLFVRCEPASENDSSAPLSEDSFSRVAAVMRLYPNGIINMNGSLEGLVECSDNVGIIATDDDCIKLTSEIRGGYQSTVDDVKKTVELVGALFGARVEFFTPYMPWEFAPVSDMRSLAMDTYRELYGEDMRQLALHAGLECGFFAEKIPGMDIISVGPNCENFHSPKERVSITSTKRFYDFLKALLAKL